MAPNRLSAEASPYLLQHAENPVDWHPWGEAALAEARSSDRPVLLSVGYAACHWCHVMAHESFEDPEVAALMNELFVNVKVDREERPDLDVIYQHALAALGQQGGWPLTMFLTPAGEPFWGGTYFPPEARWGRPAFRDVLRLIARAWQEERDKVARNVDAIRGAIEPLAQPRSGPGLSMPVTDEIAARLAQAVDQAHGGLGGAPKFPQCSVFQLLWRAWKRTGREEFRDAVVKTMTSMSQGGIYDHLGGGFSRYSTDERWLVPHFEKMLYDNAEILSLLTHVWRDTGMPLFAERVRETIGWVLEDMAAHPAPDGLAGFASSLDADSEGVEGRYYVWTEGEIDAVLGPLAPEFKRVYDVSAGGNWEHRNILNRLAHPNTEPPEVERMLADARALLKRVRDRRVRPARDDKVLADWNGLMIAALAEAAGAFQEPAWLFAAKRAFDFVRIHMTAADGRLRHSWRAGKLQHPATLDDYGAMTRAAIALFEATGKPDYLRTAAAWVERVEQGYGDPGRGGWFMTAADTPILLRPKLAQDTAAPSGAGMMVEALARLWYITGEARYRSRAEAAVAAFAGEIERNFLPLATLVNANELLERALQIVIVGPSDDVRTETLLAAVRSLSLPNAILVPIEDAAALPAGHPAAGKSMVEGAPTAYVCEGPVCSLPIADPAALRADLVGRVEGGPERAA